MSKVIVERPRLGGGLKQPKGRLRRLQRLDLDEQPSSEGMRRDWARSGNYKMLNENLAPLRRFLQRRVGHRWDKVFSEICEHVRVTSAVQKHVRDHLPDLVALHVEVEGKHVRPKASSTRWRGNEVWQPFYIHPRSGILRANPRRWKHRRGAPTRSYIVVNDTHQIRMVNGVWYEVELAPLPVDCPAVWDVVMRDRISYSCETQRQLTAIYGSVVYACDKRQLNSREIHRLRDRLEEIEKIEGMKSPFEPY